MADQILPTIAAVLLVLYVVHRIRRRLRMTPEQRLLDDQAEAQRRIARAAERNARY